MVMDRLFQIVLKSVMAELKMGAVYSRACFYVK